MAQRPTDPAYPGVDLDQAMRRGARVVAKQIERGSRFPVEPCVVTAIPAEILTALDVAKRRRGKNPKSGAFVLVTTGVDDPDGRALVVMEVTGALETYASAAGLTND